MSHEVKLTNCGPVKELTFRLEQPGVTVLQGANGSGKSVTLSAIQAAAIGKGKPPLTDDMKRGSVEAFGARITVGQTSRHTGEMQVQHLEGRFSLAELVDPGMKTPEANDARRIKALVALTGVRSDPHLFRRDKAMVDYDSVVPADAEETDDLVEMAARIKRAYDAKARAEEDAAERADGKAQGSEPPADLNLDDEHDAKVLQAEYDRLVLQRSELRAIRNVHDESKQNASHAVNDIAKLQSDYTGLSVDVALERYNVAMQKTNEQGSIVNALREKLQQAERELESLLRQQKDVEHQLEVAQLHDHHVQSLKQVVSRFESWEGPVPTDEELQYADGAVDTARVKMEHGALIREALRKQSDAESFRLEAAKARERAERYRDAGRATDDVLSGAIKCEALKVESDGKSARLTAWCEQRGKRVPYQDLSEGQRWRIAIDLGADHVGEGGLLVIDQHAWEGLDAFVRPDIHQHAVERKVHILTAEATRDPGDDPALHAVPYGGTT